MRLKYTCVGWAYLDIMHEAIKRMVKIGGMFLMTKKNFVFAASFLTMLVVNAAWADIASTNYVTAGLSDKQDKLTTSNIKGSGSVSVAISDGVITVSGTDNNMRAA